MWSRRWLAWAAAGWMLAFAAMSAYWAAGGRIGVDTLGGTIETYADERGTQFVVALWLIAALKVVAAALPIALVEDWTTAISRRWLRLSTWVMGAGMVLYACANFGARAIMALGLIETPESMHTTAARWHLFFWNPWWLLGGILYIAAARSTRK
jgi:hypothetical protein